MVAISIWQKKTHRCVFYLQRCFCNYKATQKVRTVYFTAEVKQPLTFLFFLLFLLKVNYNGINTTGINVFLFKSCLGYEIYYSNRTKDLHNMLICYQFFFGLRQHDIYGLLITRNTSKSRATASSVVLLNYFF